jgi:hypothetical protein
VIEFFGPLITIDEGAFHQVAVLRHGSFCLLFEFDELSLQPVLERPSKRKRPQAVPANRRISTFSLTSCVAQR